MERELLETFEAAKKAADEVADGGGTAEVERCIDALRRLKKMPVTMKDLVSTQVGRRLRLLTKHSQAKIHTVATDLLQYWKNVVVQETSKDNKKTDHDQVVKIKVEKNSKAGSNESKTVVKPAVVEVRNVKFKEEVQNEKVPKLDYVKSEKVSSVKLEKINGGATNNQDGVSKVQSQKCFPEKPPSAAVPLKLASLVKCNNPPRDKIRELLAEAFSKVSKETIESEVDEVRNLQDKVNGRDPIRVAVVVESALFEKLGSSTGAHKMKYRSLVFNLKDDKNKDFRRRVLLGQVKPEEIAGLAPEDMASDERKLSNKKIIDKALFECERGGAPKATTDQFKCGRCGQRKTTYYQLQTRSADEPMTTFVTCVNCNNHWKFC